MIIVRSLGRQDYEPLWRKMQHFTNERNADTQDELWFTEHPPIFTLGMNASQEHLIAPGDIQVLRVDRGGQVTYHGPGQLMVYPLIDLKRAKLGVRDLVTALEQCVVDLLEDFGFVSVARRDAPGVYVDGRKVASIGLRIRRGASYHGMALNIDVELEPFSRINPCGFDDLAVTSLDMLGAGKNRQQIQAMVREHLIRHLQLDAEEIVP